MVKKFCLVQAGDGPVLFIFSNPSKVVEDIQPYNHEKLKLVASFECKPSHVNNILDYFKPLNINGQWFKMEGEVVDLVSDVDCIKFRSILGVQQLKHQKPSRLELEKFLNKQNEAAVLFGVSKRTIRNWMKSYDLNCVNRNYGPNKLFGKIQKIIELKNNGHSIKEIALIFNVTPSAISRAIYGITYPAKKETADVGVVYNVSAVLK